MLKNRAVCMFSLRIQLLLHPWYEVAVMFKIGEEYNLEYLGSSQWHLGSKLQRDSLKRNCTHPFTSEGLLTLHSRIPETKSREFSTSTLLSQISTQTQFQNAGISDNHMDAFIYIVIISHQGFVE